MDATFEDDPPAPGPARDGRLGMLLAERYRIHRKLGEGGMGAVYEGEHVIIGKKVAIKTLHAHLATDAGIVTRFHREARAATAIGNEHIVEVTDFGSFPDGAAFMVLEYLEGIELGDLVEEKGQLTLGRTVHIVGQICDALAAAHDKGIVHRDLKPQNIYLIRRGGDGDFVKVLDFGISKVLGEGQSTGRLTATGHAMGTPYYMSPEQARGARDIDARTDIYAIGVILFNLLTGRHPFEDTSLPMLIVNICHEPPPLLRSMRPDVPEEVEATIAKMLAKDPKQRFASCREVKAALMPFASVHTAPVVVAARESADAFGETAAPPTDPFAATGVAPSEAPLAVEPAPTVAPKVAARPAYLPWIGGAIAVAAAIVIGVTLLDGGEPEAEVVVQPPPDPAPDPEPVVAVPVPIAPAAAPDAGMHAEIVPPPAPTRRVRLRPTRPETTEVASPEPAAEPPAPPPAEAPPEPAGLPIVPENALTKRLRLGGG